MKVGKNCLISQKAVFYGIDRIVIGDNVRIDDFCVISAGVGGISIGSFTHIGCHTFMAGAGRIEIGEYASISGRVNIYSSTEDVSGEFMTNPVMVGWTNVKSLPVTLEKHCLLSSGCVVLPGVTMKTGAVVGALSLVNKDIPEFEIWGGSPAYFLKKRKRDLLELEKKHKECV